MEAEFREPMDRLASRVRELEDRLDRRDQAIGELREDNARLRAENQQLRRIRRDAGHHSVPGGPISAAAFDGGPRSAGAASTSRPAVDGESPEISVVVPLYNEQENVPELHRRLGLALASLEVPYEIIFVDDGSRDDTPRLIDELHAADRSLTVIHLSRNFGHQAAVCAGLDRALGRCVMIIDGDLQDPPEVIPEFVARWREGHDVVYAVRRHRKENPLKRLGYFAFYRILKSIGDIDIPLDSGDFCLMDRRVADALRELPEQARFVRGLRTFVGFRQVGLEYERAAREAGRPKYTLRALIGLAVDGLVSFSSYPLRLATRMGITASLLALVLVVWVLVEVVAGVHYLPRGWASILVVVLFMGAVQLISLGIIGEYIRLIFLESKRRPTYVVARYLVRAASEGCEPRGVQGWAQPRAAASANDGPSA